MTTNWPIVMVNYFCYVREKKIAEFWIQQKVLKRHQWVMRKVVSADWEVTYGLTTHNTSFLLNSIFIFHFLKRWEKPTLLYRTYDSCFYAISLFLITNHVKQEAANPDEVDGDSKGQDYQWRRRGGPGVRIRWTKPIFFGWAFFLYRINFPDF